MAEPAIPVDDPNRELPGPGPVAVREFPVREIPVARVPVDESAERATSPRLNGTAEAIGSAVGSAVESVRHLPDRLQEMKERFTVIRGRAQDEAANRASDLKETAQEKARVARHRAAYYSREYPLHVIAACAGVGFLVGVVMRIWRSRRG